VCSTYRRDLARELNRLRYAENALFNGAFHVDVLHLLTEIRLGTHEPYQPVLDLQLNVSAVFDGLEDCAGRLNDEFGATVSMSAFGIWDIFLVLYVRLRRIW